MIFTGVLKLTVFLQGLRGVGGSSGMQTSGNASYFTLAAFKSNPDKLLSNYK